MHPSQLLLLVSFPCVCAWHLPLLPRARVELSRKSAIVLATGVILAPWTVSTATAATLEELAAQETQSFQDDLDRIAASFQRTTDLLDREDYQELRIVLRSNPMTLLRGTTFRAANASSNPEESRKVRQTLLNRFDQFDGFLNGARQGKGKDSERARADHAALLADIEGFLGQIGMASK